MDIDLSILRMLEREKEISFDVLVEAIEQALLTAYHKTPGAQETARVELDYRNQPSRAIFSCEASAPVGECRAVGRCPRLPKEGQTHTCFGLPAHGLPRICDNLTACD